MRPGFVTPPWTAPVDVDATLARIPKEAVTKGMYFAGLIERCAKAGVALPSTQRYHSFTDYSVTDFVNVMVRSAEALYPRETLREGLRRVGKAVYPILLESMIGKVIFGVLGSDMRAITKVAPKGYSFSGSHGRIEIVELSDTHSLVRHTGQLVFLDSYQVGVFEGVFDACNVDGVVSIKMESETDGVFLSEWRTRTG